MRYLYFYHDILKSPKILSLDRNLCQFYPLRVFSNVYPISYPPIAMSTFYVADFRGNFLPKILIRIGLHDLHYFNRKTITSRLFRFFLPSDSRTHWQDIKQLYTGQSTAYYWARRKKKTVGNERENGLTDEAVKWMKQFTEPEKLYFFLLFENKFLGAFPHYKKLLLASSCLSVRMQQSSPARRIFKKFHIRGFLEKYF